MATDSCCHPGERGARYDAPDSERVLEATGNGAAGPITKCSTKAVKAIAFDLVSLMRFLRFLTVRTDLVLMEFSLSPLVIHVGSSTW